MNETISSSINVDYTGYFNGKPCQVSEDWHIILPQKDLSIKAIHAFVESEEFQMLENAGIEVHSGGYS